jgi:hypothetical protein
MATVAAKAITIGSFSSGISGEVVGANRSGAFTLKQRKKGFLLCHDQFRKTNYDSVIYILTS